MLSVLLPLTCNSQGGLAAQIRFTSCLPLLLSQAGSCSPRGGRLWRYSRIVAGMFTMIGRKWELKGVRGAGRDRVEKDGVREACYTTEGWGSR